MDKRVIGGIVIAIGLFGGIWFYTQEGQVLPQTNTKVNPTQTKPAQFYSVNGKVKAIAGSNYTLTLADGKTVKTFSVPAGVEVVRRVTTKTGFSLASDKLTNVKIGSEVVFYTKSTGSSPDALVVARVEIVK